MWNIVAVILVLAIVAIGLLEVYQSYESGTNAQSGQDLVTETSSTIANLQTVYGQTPNLSSFTGATPYAVGALPSDWTGTNSPYTIASGGSVAFTAIQITENGAAPTQNNGYQMVFSGLSVGQCAALANFSVPEMYSAQVNGGVQDTNPAYNGAGNQTSGSGSSWPPVLAASCTNGATNTITYEIVG